MIGHTICAIMEIYDVAMLAGHNVMHYNDSLKGDYVHELFGPHSYGEMLVSHLPVLLSIADKICT